MHDALAGIFYLLANFIWWAVLLPAALLVSTPIILVCAVGSQKPYRVAVSGMYRAIVRFWKEWGVVFLP